VPPPASNPLPHRPGLDGLRGLAVAAVVVYHLGYGWAGGGFLGVSLFFTLSGYLVTSVLLADAAATARPSLRHFWARRARRILPAAFALLAVVSLVGGLGRPTPGLAGDVRAALGQVANWRFIAAHRSYAEQFAAPSPLRHLWSLAIEEQLYLALPLVAWLALRRGRRTLAVVLALACAASVAASFALAGASFDRVYQGTDTRAVELLVGALAACLVTPARLAAARAGRAAWLAACGALGAVGALWGLTRLDHVWLRHGGFGAVALVHLALVLVGAGPVGSRLLGVRPLAALGRVSYGVYLYHWPLVVWITPASTGWPGPVVDAVRVGGALVAAVISLRVLEAPVRAGRVPRRVSLRLGGIAFAGVLAASLLVPHPAPAGAAAALARYRAIPLPQPGAAPSPPPAQAAPPARPVGPSPAETAPPPATPSDAADAPGAPVVVLPDVTLPTRPLVWLVGDSVPYSLASQLADALDGHGADLLNLAVPACDGARGNPTTRLGIGVEDTETRPECLAWAERWPAFAAERAPDAVLFVLGGTTTLDRRIGGTWRNPCQAPFRTWYEPEVLARLDWVLERTAAVPVLATSPWAEDRVVGVLQGDHRKRTDCVNAVYRDVAAARPAVRLVDFQAIVCPAGEDAPCAPWRGDGLHFDGDGAVAAAAWLADRAADALAAGRPAPSG
jgi:peptidoglycan/LPS O-acetylase OafA/YrhL/lysophospholipase L1-like esterase